MLKKKKKKCNNKNKKIKTNKIIKILLLITELKLSIKVYNIKNYGYLLDDIMQNKKIIYKTKRLFLFKEDIIENKNKKNEIHISMTIDNNGLYPSLVSMCSALENNNKTQNLLVYHLLLSYNFNKDLINYFESFKNSYEVKINYYIIPNIFKKYNPWTMGTRTIYFKLLLPFIMNDLDRIIFLDADTLIFKDLFEMYTLPFYGNYALGFPFHSIDKIDKFVKGAKYYINVGVLLLNLKEIRNDNKDYELIRFTIKKNKVLFFPEQDSLNIVFFKKIGILPLKYGIFLFSDIEIFKKSIKNGIRIKLNETEIINNFTFFHEISVSGFLTFCLLEDTYFLPYTGFY
jgi:lipopolysaccharide biosynthesis glycosyltransferase